MRLDHEFTVPAPVDRVWQLVLDPERVAPCMPGASLSEVDGDMFRGSVKVRLGPVNLLYKGSGEFREKDEQARKLVIHASGKDSRGAGTAAATVTVTLTPEGSSTRGAVVTDLNITGRPAQFGRGMVSDVGGRILEDFAGSLARELGSPGPTADTTDRTQPASDSPDAVPRGHSESAPEGDRSDAVDLMQYAGTPLTKRVVLVLVSLGTAGAVAAVVLAVRRGRER